MLKALRLHGKGTAIAGLGKYDGCDKKYFNINYKNLNDFNYEIIENIIGTDFDVLRPHHAGAEKHARAGRRQTDKR